MGEQSLRSSVTYGDLSPLEEIGRKCLSLGFTVLGGVLVLLLLLRHAVF